MADRMPPRRDWLGPIALVLVVAVFVGGYLLFPRLAAVFSYQDCIASGRITGCG